MMKLLKINVLVLVLCCCAAAANAQKFGHLNSGNLILLLPETKVADEKLKVYQDSLVKIGEERAKALEAEAAAFLKEYEAGGVKPVDAQKKQSELQEKQQRLGQFEEEVVAAVAQKREMLISPILEKVQNAINEVGKEGGYTMIFDTSVFNTILFVQETDNVEPQVKLKLGLK